MNEKKREVKKPIWIAVSKDDIKKGQEEFKKRIQFNDKIRLMLKNRAEEFTIKSKSTPVLTRMDEFFSMAQLQKMDHRDTLELIQWLWEYITAINNDLAKAFQHIEDNMQSIAEKTDTKLREMKNNVADVQKTAIVVYKTMKGEQSSQATDEWKKATGDTRGYVS